MNGDERATPQVEIPPTRVSRRARRGPYVLLAIGIAGLVGAVALAQLTPDQEQPPISIVLPTAPPAPTAAPAAVPTPTIGPPPDPAPPRLTPRDLTAAVADGSLDGRLVFIDGTLDVTETDCAPSQDGRGGPCVDLKVPGLGLDVRPEPVAMPWRGEPPPGAWIVTVAKNGRLGYLGSLVPSPVMAGDATEMVVRLLNGDLRSAGSLYQLGGFLVVNPIRPCDRPDASRATPCPLAPPFLAAEAPLADGSLHSNRGGDVALATPVVDVDPAALVTPGLFLLTPPATCDLDESPDGCVDVPWTVVGRYEPTRSVRVLVP
jgi:hypothetical protein